MAQPPKVTNCLLCARPLNTHDPLSNDCGGECWGCISEIEAEMIGKEVEDYRLNHKQYTRDQYGG